LGIDTCLLYILNTAKMKHILEAQRHIENAKEILSSKAQKEDGYYQA
jgi:hypothetical protein